MRVAALYDIHGNLPALDAVLADLDTDVIVVGGDAVVGAWPAETLERLRALDREVRWVRGNTERELTEPQEDEEHADVLDWVRGKLTDEQLSFLNGLPQRATVDVEGVGPVLFSHATPRSDDEVLTRISPDERWAEALAGIDERVFVCGHTHMQFDREVQGVRVVNSGSVGMPYEEEPGAYWTHLGPTIEHRYTTYTAGDIAGSGYPGEWSSGTPEETTELFERFSRERA
ncbi:MAG TPA: metallophosphoesterase family protein [Gaiellaceae bacterium]|nr:metallophosphoesterase family protein [Gaiellaceae bacterium]